MGVFDLFSKRQKALRGETPDVYIYDQLPNPLRVQVIHIWDDTLGNEDQYQSGLFNSASAYQFIVETLCREYGVFKLVKPQHHGHRDYRIELANFILQEEDHERVLDAIELSFRIVDTASREWEFLRRNDASDRADAAILELNARFQEHGVGYRFEEREMVRIDSEMVHAEVTIPALVLLRAPEYKGAQAEFLQAHEHYRHGRHKEALADCLKAFESVMKSICAKRKWKHAPNATSKGLIQVLLDNDLIPPFWSQHFSGLRATLEGGVPTARNRLGGHGQGSGVVEVPSYLVAYVLHQTASLIVFLAEAEKSRP